MLGRVLGGVVEQVAENMREARGVALNRDRSRGNVEGQVLECCQPGKLSEFTDALRALAHVGAEGLPRCPEDEFRAVRAVRDDVPAVAGDPAAGL